VSKQLKINFATSAPESAIFVLKSQICIDTVSILIIFSYFKTTPPATNQASLKHLYQNE